MLQLGYHNGLPSCITFVTIENPFPKTFYLKNNADEFLFLLLQFYS